MCGKHSQGLAQSKSGICWGLRMYSPRTRREERVEAASSLKSVPVALFPPQALFCLGVGKCPLGGLESCIPECQCPGMPLVRGMYSGLSSWTHACPCLSPLVFQWLSIILLICGHPPWIWDIHDCSVMWDVIIPPVCGCICLAALLMGQFVLWRDS